MQGVIFDLDGTLLDTIGDLAAAMNRALSAGGFAEHSVETYMNYVGDGAKKLVYRALPEDARSEKNIERTLNVFAEDYAANWAVSTAVFAGIDNCLKKIADSGRKLAVLSNKPDRYMENIRKLFFAGHDFVCFSGKREEFLPKPDPAGALFVAKEMGLEPADIFYVGDSNTDMKTAVNAGFYPCAVTWGYRGRAELIESGARSVVDLPEQINDLLDSL